MKYILTFLVFAFSTNVSFSQLYKSHNWEEKPTYVEITKEEAKLASVAVKEKYLIQYYKAALGNSIKLFETKQAIIRVNTDKGIEKHNRVYIPMYNVVKVIDIKARVTEPDGSFKVLNQKSIKELKNVKDYGNFKIFAIEGVTKGSQVEYIYTLELRATSIGSVIVQKDYKVKNAEVIIRKPRILQARLKSYNGFPEMNLEKVEGNKEAYTAQVTDIPAMIEEKSAAPDANRVKLSYQVANSFMSDTDRWENLAGSIQGNYIKIDPKRHSKLIKDYEGFANKESRQDTKEKVNTICKYITQNYNIIRERNDDLGELKNVFKKKKGTENGIIKVYSCLLNYERVGFNFLLTSNRYRHKFDEEFYSNANLQEAFLHIYDEDMYVNPGHINARLVYPSNRILGNKGIFIAPTGWSFETVSTPGSENSITKRTYEISVDTDEFIVDVIAKQELTGYRGDNTRNAYNFFKNNDINEFKNFTTVSGIEDAKFKSFEIANDDFSLSTTNVPFKIDGAYTSESLLETAGNNLLLSFGKVIGTQNEFYQEVERVNPVIVDNLNKYDYEINIQIPSGYAPKDLDDIKINQVLKIDGQPGCHFISNYSVEGDLIKIIVSESYDQIAMPLKDYEAFKDVVNAAFDFSKKSILFEKI